MFNKHTHAHSHKEKHPTTEALLFKQHKTKLGHDEKKSIRELRQDEEMKWKKQQHIQEQCCSMHISEPSGDIKHFPNHKNKKVVIRKEVIYLLYTGNKSSF